MRGGQHFADECRFNSEMCHKCGKKGHIQKVCRSLVTKESSQLKGEGRKRTHAKEQGQRAHHISDKEKRIQKRKCLYCIDDSVFPYVATLTITLIVNETETQFEVDTCCKVTVINETDFNKLGNSQGKPELKKCPIKLKTYTGQKVEILGSGTVGVKHKKMVKDLPLIIVLGTGPNLLGHDWIKELELEWNSVNHTVGTNVQT